KDIVIDTDSTSITIRTNPSGLQFTVDNNRTQIAPQTLALPVGQHPISVAPIQTLAGFQYTFTGWSDGGAASHSITVGTSPSTYVATFASLQGIEGGGLSVPSVTAISANGYFSIFGQNFISGAPALLNPGQVVNGSLPINIGSTCVNVGGQFAFPTYVSQTQINAIAPAIQPGSSQPVSVTVNCGTANPVTLPPFSVATSAATPEFLYWVQFANGQDPAIAVDAVHGDYIGPPGLIPGVTLRAAHAGDVLTLYGVAFGHTVSGGPLPGALPSSADSAPPGYSVSIGASAANASYVGVSPGSAGLYQVNLSVPSGLSPGNHPIILTVNGVPTPSGAFLTIGP